MTQTTLSNSDIIQTAINRIREHEPEEGYYLAFSGGKDSICCYHLAKMAGVKFTAHYSMTTIDRPEFYTYAGKHILNPIIDWKDSDVWEFIKSHNLAYPSLYDEGYKRAGCIMCPLACRQARVRDYNAYPQHVKAIERAVGAYLSKRGSVSGLYNWGSDAHEIVYYWVHDSPIESAKGPCLSQYLGGV